MTDIDKMPSRLAIIEAAKRTGSGDEEWYVNSVLSNPHYFKMTILAASLIEKYEPETLVDPVILKAREIYAEMYEKDESKKLALKGRYDNFKTMEKLIKAIEAGIEMGSSNPQK